MAGSTRNRGRRRPARIRVSTDIGQVRIRVTGVVAGSARVFSSEERQVLLTDTHVRISAPVRVHAGYDAARKLPAASVERLEGEAVTFELGTVPVSFEPGFLRSKLRIGDFDLRIRPLQRGKARKLAELAGGGSAGTEA